MVVAIVALAVASGVVGKSCAGVWPRPRECMMGNSTLMVPQSFSAQLDPSSRASSHPALLAALTRCAAHTVGTHYLHLTRGSTEEPISTDDDDDDNNNEVASESPAGLLEKLTVKVLSNASGMRKGPASDESYELVVGVDGATLSANTVWGALYGLETFSQLVRLVEGTDTTNASQLISGAPMHIKDSPRFGWRGLMVDTSNHYLPMPLLLRTVDAMAQNKMNVLHFHMIDSYSFPYVSPALPLLAAKGAWHSTQVYTPADLDRLVQHAQLMGVRVVFELDMPGVPNDNDETTYTS